jgi:2-polyprenyl-3-methyl-5-hydroxy-6-metoxy-1,4-benzoquinol methylase
VEAIKDILDFSLEILNLKSINLIDYINPEKYKNVGDQDLFGFPPNSIPKAALLYLYYEKNLEFEKATSILSDLKISIIIEELANVFKHSIFKNIKQSIPWATNMSFEDIMSELYSEFTGKPKEEVLFLIINSRDIYTRKWSEIIPDEDNVTPSLLGNFYNSLLFPVGSLSSFNPDSNNLSMAYNALPILIINSIPEVKTVFDFGGNIGETVTAIASSCNVESCLLIEENETALEFAKWRNKKLGIDGIVYKKESALEKDINDYQQTFDFGICTEVLEHVFNVEETIAIISALLKTGGYLYFSASFGLYPRPSHLKKNTVYANHEDKLMAQYGLKRVNISGLPLPLLSNMRIYQKSN